MGLDISHYKLIPYQNERTEFFLKDEFDIGLRTGSIPNSNYKIKSVEGIWEYIAIFKSSEELTLANVYLNELADGYTNYKLRLVEGISTERDILEFEKNQKLSGLLKSSETSEIEIKTRKIQFQNVFYEGSLNCYVSYVKEVGYQRKGMSPDFFDYFENDCFYTDKISFEKLLEFSDKKNHMYDPDNIKTNFIENYEDGKSILLLSW